MVELYAVENGRVLDPDSLVDYFSRLDPQQRALLLQAGFNINYEVVYYYFTLNIAYSQAMKKFNFL